MYNIHYFSGNWYFIFYDAYRIFLELLLLKGYLPIAAHRV